MADPKPTLPHSGLLAHKGTARPASALRFVSPAVAPAHPDGTAEVSPPAESVSAPGGPQADRKEDGLAAAASLQVGGFTSATPTDRAPPAPPGNGSTDAGESPPESSPVAAASPGSPPHPEPAIDRIAAAVDPPPFSALRARAGKLHQLTIGAGFALLIVASLGVGYAISIAVQAEPGARQGDPVADAVAPRPPASAARSTVKSLRGLAGPGSVIFPDTRDPHSGPLPGSELQYTVQIGSAPDRQTAEQLWHRLAGAHADLFADRELDIRRVGVAEGVDHWLQTGTFGEIALARSLCEKIRARQLDCQVVKK